MQIWQRVRGQLTSIAIGPECLMPADADGVRHPTRQIVFGTNAKGAVYVIASETLGDWKRLPGSLAQVAVAKDCGSDGNCIVWGINDKHAIFWLQMDATASTWQRVPGALKFISLGPAGVWGITPANRLVRYQTGRAATEPWETMAENIAIVAVGTSGIMVSDKDGKLSRGTETADGFTLAPIEGGLFHLAMADDLSCGVSTRGAIYYQAGDEKRWVRLADNTSVQFRTCATNGREIWGLDKQSGIWRWNV